MNNLNWHNVVSSNLEKIAYDETEKELYVEFKSGNKYSYVNVPRKKFNELMRAESHGAYFSKNIKPNYDYRDWN